MLPSPDPLHNPYAPPASGLAEPLDARASSKSTYEGQRRSVVLLLLLSVVTLGVYPLVWYVRRAPFLDALFADKKVGALPWVNVVAYAAFVLATIAGAPEELSRLMEVALSLVNLFLAFRVARILRIDLARSGRSIGISGAGVFFFGCLYLQHVMNEAADMPARPAGEMAADPPLRDDDYDGRIDRELKNLED